MNFRCVVFLFLVSFFWGCDFFSDPPKDSDRTLTTIVDFTQVDVSPKFDTCKNLPDNKSTTCFREEIHARVSKSLQEYQFITEKNINELVEIDVLITAEGRFAYKKIKASEKVINQLPELEDAIKFAIENLPKVTPAMKQNIPVATQYQLPIKIQTNEV